MKIIPMPEWIHVQPLNDNDVKSEIIVSPNENLSESTKALVLSIGSDVEEVVAGSTIYHTYKAGQLLQDGTILMHIGEVLATV